MRGGERDGRSTSEVHPECNLDHMSNLRDEVIPEEQNPNQEEDPSQPPSRAPGGGGDPGGGEGDDQSSSMSVEDGDCRKARCITTRAELSAARALLRECDRGSES